MIIGNFGDIIFETSSEKILNFSDFRRDVVSRWGKHDVIGRKPVTEFIGPDLDMITFVVNLHGTCGVNANDEMDKWLIYCRNGEAHTLTIGSKSLGVDKWIVQSVGLPWNIILGDGKLLSGKVEVTLQEYVEVI